MKILSLQRSYFTKLFATVLLVFFCATVVCTVFLYKNNYQQMTMEKEILNQSQIYSYRQNLDTQFDSAVSFIENFRNDTNFAEYGVGKQSGQQIYKRLAQYRFLSDNLGISVGVLDRDNNICIMSDGYNKIDTQRLGLDGAEMSLNRYSMLRTGGVIPMKDGQDMDGAVFAIEQRYSNESTLLFLFAVYNINNLIISDRDNFIVRYDNQTVFMSKNEAVPEWVFEMSEESKSSDGIAAYSTSSNSVLGITYFYITNAVRPQIILQTTILFFILLLMGLLLTVLIVRKLYNPIGQVVKKARTINDSEYFDEMEFIHQTVNMMQGDLSKLRETDQKKMSIIRNKFVHDLCIGVITYDEAKQLVPEYSLDILTQPHFVVCVEIIAMGENYQDIDGEIYVLVKKDIVEMFITQVFGDKKVYAVEFASKRFGFIVSGAREGMKERLNQIGQCLEREYDIDIIAGMGNTALDFAQTQQSYLEAVNILENNFFADDQYVGVIDDIKDIDTEIYYPFEIEQRIIESIVQRKPDHAVNLMDKIFEININNGMNATKWTEIRFLVMSTINRIVNRMNETIEGVLGEGIILYLELRTKKGAELQETVRDILRQIGEFAKSGETEESEQLNRIVSFIDNNLEHDISLTDLADHMNLSTGYVSRLFKNIVKQNFKIYVNQRRVERAKQILKERGNIKVSELAEMVGCNNTVTFTRIFKKYTGMTPGEYING